MPFNARFITVSMASCRMAELLVMVPLVKTRSSLMFGWKALPLLRLTYQGCRDPACSAHSVSAAQHILQAAARKSTTGPAGLLRKFPPDPQHSSSSTKPTESGMWSAEWLNHRSLWSRPTSKFQTGSGSGCKTWGFNTAQKHRIVNCDIHTQRHMYRHSILFHLVVLGQWLWWLLFLKPAFHGWKIQI